MNTSELSQLLKDWGLMQEEIKSLKNKLKEYDYKITPSYSDTGVFGGQFSSKVESLAMKRLKIKNRLDTLESKTKLCIEAYRNSDLSEIEKKTIKYTVENKNLLLLAWDNAIGQARIYRIRGRAILKMCKYINNTTN